MMRLPLHGVPILIVAVAWTFTAVAAPNPVLTMDGLGPLRFGMTVGQIERAIGPLDISYYEGSQECGEGGPKKPWIRGASLMIIKGRLARIDIFVGTDSTGVGTARSKITTKTEAGIGLGSTMAEVKRAYRGRLTVTPRPYEEETEHDLIVKDSRRGRKIVFETENGRIDTFRAGLNGPVDYIEGCS